TTLRAYDMNEGTGLTVRDASGHQDGSMNSTLGWAQNGKFGPSVVSPGPRPSDGPAIDAGSASPPSGAFTMETWIKRAFVDIGGRVGGHFAAQDSQTGFSPRFDWSLDPQITLPIRPP